ncbi:MAG: DUF4838 domain-containing protein [Verrucomicrobiae bacterium]|nr:DUF4838 domain-containing protein [Verrucomicrobiae bacterium]
MTSLRFHLSSLLTAWALIACAMPVRALTLVENGQARARIVLSERAATEEEEAAAEIARVLEAMSGAKLPVEKASAPPSGPCVVLGALAHRMGLKIEKVSRAKDGFRYAARGDALLLVGESPAGVYTGAIRFLESLGCGWYTPGDVGEVIPKRPTIAIPDGTEAAEASNSINRRFWYGGGGGQGGGGRGAPLTKAWLRRMNGANYESGSWSHAYGNLISKETLKEHPEYGSLVRGKRTTKQLCTTNPNVVRLAAETLMKHMAKTNLLVFAAGPNDGGGLCECAECTKLDTPEYLEPSSGKPVTTDRVFGFASAVAALTAKAFPDRDLGILIYSEYSRTPKKAETVSANVFPMLAPIRRCRIHGPGNPCCEMNRLLQEEIRGWAKLGPKLGFYMYNYNLADTLMPFSKVDFYKRTLAEVNAANVEQLAWIFETIDTWSAHAPSLWLSARISWNTHLDVDREMERFYAGFYGAAAAPMRDYWKRLDDAYANAPTHAGSSYGMHKVWTPPLLAASRADLDRAAKLASNAREQRAVAMAEAGLRSAELFIQIWHALAACDFATAAARQAALGEHCKMMDAQPEPHWAHLRYAFTQYYMVFVGKVVDAGQKILSEGGKIVARLPETWKFSTDEKGAGATAGWTKADFDDSGWKTMGTMSTCWADEGLAWHHGDAWYRTTFEVPASAKGANLHLWFGGFDENVEVWLNGQPLGEKKGFVKPQAFANIGPHLKFGGKNVLAVRVASGSLAEIGTGGIMMPVLIYEGKGSDGPSDGKKPAYEM